jgi:hypothetical protein
MKILHLSHTPPVGAPGCICCVLNMYVGVESRWAALDAEAGAYGKMAFDLDLRWDRDQDEILALADGCDVLHLHNYLGLDSREFAPLDFRALWEDSKPMVRHFHSTPDLIARFTKQPGQSVLDCPIPKLVIAQYPERFFPNAKLVPNIVLPEASDAAAETPAPSTIRIGYAPSRFNSARASRMTVMDRRTQQAVADMIGRNDFSAIVAGLR